MKHEWNERAVLDKLKTLCDIDGTSGAEKKLALWIAEQIRPFCDKLYLDKLGNLIAFKKGAHTPREPIMYCAHLDEVGVQIRHINEDGTLLFEQVGMLAGTLPSKRVEIGEARIPGVICSKPVHLTRESGAKAPKTDDLYIDIGCFSREQAEKLGVYAAYGTFVNDFTVFGDGNLVRSKAIDDRFGCLVMTELLNGALNNDSYFVFTLGEELGGVGAVAAVREIRPGIAVIFESTTASDLPCNEGAARVCSLGGGAVVPFMDGGTLYDRALYRHIREEAAANGIKTQTKSRVAGGTDAASIQRSADGVRVCAVSLACRYIHTASCVAAVSDMKECLALAGLIDEKIGVWMEETAGGRLS